MGLNIVAQVRHDMADLVAYPAPPEGDCVTPDGRMNEVFDHTNQSGRGVWTASREARAICEGCPVLRECQDWAAQFHDWSGVTVAGWTPRIRNVGYAPPWAEEVVGRHTATIRASRRASDLRPA